MGYIKEEHEPVTVVGSGVVYAKDGIESYVYVDLMSDGSVRWRRYDEDSERYIDAEKTQAAWDALNEKAP